VSVKWCVSWRRKWQPTPVFLPGEFHEQATVHGVAKSLPLGNQKTVE